MKELDLTGAKLLKLWLSIGYHDYQITGEKDICTLVRMCLKSGLSFVGYLFMLVFMLGVGGAILWFVCLMFSFLTLFLPEAYYVDIKAMTAGGIFLAMVCVVTLLGFIAEVLQGKRKFAPEYMKRPLRKLFKKVYVSKEESTVDVKPCEEYKPSPTWIACKEMYRSIKEKTCIKVKL